MSNFKIESILPSSTLQARQVQLPPAPVISINISTLSLLTYDLDILLESVSDYLKGENNQQLLNSTLKVLGSSLNDKKLSNNLEKIILQHDGKSKRIYGLMIIWSHCCSNFVSVMLKLPLKLRKFLINNILSFYLMERTSGQGQIRKNISQLIAITDQKQLASSLCSSYLEKKEPLVILLAKCKEIKTQSDELLMIIQSLLKYAVQKSDAKILTMLENITQNQPYIQYLIKQLPNITTTLIKHFRKIINLYNVFDQHKISSQFGSMIRSATKEWLEEQHHYWQCVDKYYANNSNYRLQVILWGKELGKQNIFNQSMSIKYLYNYFQGDPFEFDVQDRLIASSQCHEPWVDTYRSISQCSSYECFNLIALNVTNVVKHWKVSNPFALQIKHKGLRKMVENYKDGFQKIQQYYLSKNKKIQMGYSTLVIQYEGEQRIVTFQQIIDFLDKDIPLGKKSYRNEYQPYQEEIKVKEEPRKDHNIVVEARLVRLLKRNKISLTVDWLAKQSGYEQSIVALGMKRLCNKGIAEVDQKQNYTYVP